MVTEINEKYLNQILTGNYLDDYHQTVENVKILVLYIKENLFLSYISQCFY